MHSRQPCLITFTFVLSVEQLAVANNRMSSNLPSSFSSLGGLQVLDLEGNRFDGPLPTGFFSNLVKLRVLNLSDNFFRGSLPSDWSPFQDLVELRLNTNWASNNPLIGFQGTIAPSIGSLTKLEQIILYENRISGSIPPEMGNLVNLQTLDLAFTEMTGTVPPELSSLQSLQALYTYESDIEGSIPEGMCDLNAFIQTDCDVTCSCCAECFSNDVAV